MTEITTPFDQANLATVMETLKNYSVDYSHLGEDYIISRISAVKPQFKRKLMGRFDGLTVLVSVKGTLHLTLNMESVVVRPNSAVFIAPETFLRPEKVDEEELEFFPEFFFILRCPKKVRLLGKQKENWFLCKKWIMERWFEKSCRYFFAYLFAGINIYPYICISKIKNII